VDSAAVSPKLRTALDSLRGRRTGPGFSLENAASLLDGAPEIQEELKHLTDSIDEEARSLGNRLLRQHSTLLQEIVAAGPVLLGDAPLDEEDDETDSEESTAGRSVEPHRDLRLELAAQLLIDALRRGAAATFIGRPAVAGRAGRVLALLGDRVPPDDQLASLGERIVARTDVRTVIRSPRAFVMGAPIVYSRFRREQLRAGRLFRSGATELVRQQKITGPEVDVLILLMLQNARALLQAKGWRASDALE
jgi:hypothetical protein